MEIKKFFKNRNKFVELDIEEYNNLISKINFVKEQETALFFLNKSNVVEQDDFHHGDMECNDSFVNHYDGTR